MKLNRDFLHAISEHIATVFGVGYTAHAPGTIGSLFGLLIYMFIKDTPNYVFAALVVVLFVAGTCASSVMEDIYDMKDPSFVIIDEVVGMLLSLMFVPYSPMIAILGFLLFRIIDITKIPPLNWLENIHGGFGIMLDDAAGGIMVNIILQVIFR
jgi:phosphatidylglycerophosphatase A